MNITGIEQAIIKGRYYTPEDAEGNRKIIHPETNTKSVIDETGKTLDVILTEKEASAKAYADQKIADLVNGAPEEMDTLKELADLMSTNSDAMDTLTEAIGTKATKTEVTEGLATKADIETTYSKTEVDTAISAAKTEVTGKIDEVPKVSVGSDPVADATIEAKDIYIQLING